MYCGFQVHSLWRGFSLLAYRCFEHLEEHEALQKDRTPMYARVVTIHLQPGKIEEAVHIYHDSVIAAAKQLLCIGMLVSGCINKDRHLAKPMCSPNRS